FAPGTTAPFESVMVPDSEPDVTCAGTIAAAKLLKTTNAAQRCANVIDALPPSVVSLSLGSTLKPAHPEITSWRSRPTSNTLNVGRILRWRGTHCQHGGA